MKQRVAYIKFELQHNIISPVNVKMNASIEFTFSEYNDIETSLCVKCKADGSVHLTLFYMGSNRQLNIY